MPRKFPLILANTAHSSVGRAYAHHISCNKGICWIEPVTFFLDSRIVWVPCQRSQAVPKNRLREVYEPSQTPGKLDKLWHPPKIFISSEVR